MTAQNNESALTILKTRFALNPSRHENIAWNAIQSRLLMQEDKLHSLALMEESGGEPDVVGYDHIQDEFFICDCSAESPRGRRNLCYDHAAWESRKKNRPQSSAVDMALSMNIELLTEDQYRSLQKLGEFDTKTSSWVATPAEIRSKGGALFCDRRYDHIFLYHNGAESYYASRGFRGLLRV